MVTSLEKIAVLSTQNEQENDAFTAFLKAQESHEIDKLVYSLNKKIEPAIDCTACGNCCKTLMINVTEAEATNLSQHLQQPIATVKQQYLEKGLGNQYIINKMPCHFFKQYHLQYLSTAFCRLQGVSSTTSATFYTTAVYCVYALWPLPNYI